MITVTKEARVSDFNDIYALTENDILSLTGETTLEVLSSGVTKINVTFDNVATYNVTLDYSFSSATQIDYDGNVEELKIPLTSYSAWLNAYGKNWSILFLNNQTQKYFNKSNDVATDKLYGYFSVAIFKEQVKDLNYYFQSNTGGGCMSFYRSKQIVGSELYKFFGSLQDTVFFSNGYVGMAFCEIVNDSNAIYESYFFFLDESSDLPFISNSGADNADDDDSALENTGEDIADGLSNNMEDLGTWFNDFFTGIGDFFGWVGSILIILIVVGAVIFIIYLTKK